MKTEYIICTKGETVRIFMNRYGLCISKMENGRFLPFEILLADAKYDFCVASLGSTIHIVCQGSDGSLLHLRKEGDVWQKTVILESKEKQAYPKYFKMVPVNNFLNLFYVIGHDEKSMLIHQILSDEAGAPEVVDYITPVGERFFASPHISTDISLCYINKNGVLGTKVFRWSHKSFMQFIPFFRQKDIMPAFFLLDSDKILASAVFLGNKRPELLFFSSDSSGGASETIVSYLDSYDTFPVFYEYEDKIYLEWILDGTLFVSVSSDGGRSFSAPKKYVKNTMTEAKLFHIISGEKTIFCYGKGTDREIKFYSVPDILEKFKEKSHKTLIKSGEDIENFLKEAKIDRARSWEDDPYVTQKELIFEISKLQKEINLCKKRLEELNGRINGDVNRK